jgi:hypothetical protein
MAKRKKGSKVQKRAKPRKGNLAKRGRARKEAKSATTKRTVAKAKSKRGTVTKEVRPSAPAVETAVVEKPAPDVTTVTERLDPAA